MLVSLRDSAAAAVRALQEWYAADSYAASTGLYHWDDPDLGADFGSIPAALIVAYGYRDAAQDTLRWWNSANAMTALIDYMLLTNDTTYLAAVQQTFNNAPNAYRISVSRTVGGVVAGAVGGAAVGFESGGWFGAVIGAIGGALVGGGVAAASFAREYNTNFLDNFYDDDGWWALAWIRAFDLTGDRKYLDKSVTIFNAMTAGVDGTCKGGLYWSKDHTDGNGHSPYKNAIANELFLAVAAGLGLRFQKLSRGGPAPPEVASYLEWARREWQWFNTIGLINSRHLINDSLTTSEDPGGPCRNNGAEPVYSYNQGVILGALLRLVRNRGRPQLSHGGRTNCRCFHSESGIRIAKHHNWLGIRN